MSPVRYDLIRKDDRLFFRDGEKYVLIDTGFLSPGNRFSVSVDGRIGPFAANRIPPSFFEQFIPMKMDDGQPVSAVFNPLDAASCLLKGDIIEISENETVIPEGCKHFLEFVQPPFPLVEGAVNGRQGRLLFDTGARMTMLTERFPGMRQVRSYTEWLGLAHCFAELPVFPVVLTFPDGFEYRGEGALVEHEDYARQALLNRVVAVLGIDIFDHYDILIAGRGEKRGIFLYEKKR